MNAELQSRVEQEVAAGRFWRAKEILRSNFPHGFDPDYCEAYGQVLLQMNDLLEAGRYLFVSGVRLPEYEAAIHVFLDRFQALRTKGRYSILPGRINRTRIDDWPPTVQDELRSLGVYQDIQQHQKLHSPHPAAHRFMDRLAPCGCIVFLIVIVLLAMTGLLALLSMLLGHPLF